MLGSAGREVILRKEAKPWGSQRTSSIPGYQGAEERELMSGWSHGGDQGRLPGGGGGGSGIAGAQTHIFRTSYVQ